MNWAKVLKRTLLVAAGMVVLLVAAAYVIVHTKAFSNFVLRKTIQEAESATGSRVDIRGMEIHWNKLDVDLYGLVIQGKGAPPQPPLFRAEHIGVGLKIISILRRKVDLSELVVDQPVLDLRVDAQGQTNIPASPTKSSTSPADALFNLAIGHLAVKSGQILYKDAELPLSVDLRDFHANSNYGLLTGKYQGTLDYDQGHVRLEDFNSIEHAAQIKFTASRSELDVEPLVVTSGATHLTTNLKLTNYDSPDVQGTYSGNISTVELGRVLKTSDLPVGLVDVNGSLRYRYLPNGSFLQSVYVDGKLSTPRLAVQFDRASTVMQAVKGAFSLDQGNLHVADVEADLLRGHLKGQGEMLNLAGSPSTKVSAELTGISLEAVNNALPPGPYDRVRVAGNANISAQASWPSRIQDIATHLRIAITAPNRQTAAPSIPVNGLLDVRYDGARNSVAFGQSHLQTGSTQISLLGTLSKNSNLTLQANTTDLHELTALVSEISAATSTTSNAAPASLPDLHGQAHFSGVLSGPAKDPKLQGQLTASNVQVDGSEWRSIRTNVQLSSSQVSLQNGMLQSATRGQLIFSASAGLDHWSLGPASALSIQTSASNLSLAALEHLAKQNYPVDGTVSADISINGTKQNPSGHGSVQITKASAWDQPVNNFSAKFDASGSAIKSTAELQLPAGNVNANVTFEPQTKRYDASVDTSGFKIGQLQAVQQRGMNISGLLTASARGQGSLDNPQLSAKLQISQLQFRDQSISSVDAALNVAQQHANFTLHSVVAQGDVEAKGDVALTGDYNSTATLDVRALPVGALLETYIAGVPPGLHGQTEIHAELNGPLKQPSLVQAHVEVPSFNLAYEAANLSLVRPLKLDYRQGIATLQETEFKGTGTDLTLRGVIPIKSNGTSFNIGANGTMDLSLLQGFARGVKSSGHIDLQVNGKGDLNNPSVQGQVKLVNAYFSSDSSPLGIEGVNGQINLSGRRFEIAQLTGQAGGGKVSVQGFMVYGSPSNFNLSVQTDSVRLRYPEGLRSVLNSNLQLSGTTAASMLTGRVVVDRLSFTQQFDLANFAAQFTSGVSAPSSSPFEQNMKLNIAVQTSQNINLASSQLSIQGAANMNVVGTAADPVILGRATLSGGDLFFMGKRYEVQSGTIEFPNPVQTEPVLNLYIKTTVQQYDITLNLTGPADRLRTNYTSNPPLPASDVINLLTSGVTAEESAANNTPASTSAESVVASGVAGQFSGKIQKLAGISQLTIDPLAASNTTDPGAQVSIQQRVTGNILLTFSTDVTSTQATTVQVQYRMTRQTSVSVLRDQNGGYAIDVRYHKTF